MRSTIAVIGACLAAGTWLAWGTSIAQAGNGSGAGGMPKLVALARFSDHTGLDDSGALLSRHLPPRLHHALKDRDAALFVLAEGFPALRSCVAVVGITATGNRAARGSARPQDRPPRRGVEDWDEQACKRQALVAALSEFGKTGPQGPRRPDPANDGRAMTERPRRSPTAPIEDAPRQVSVAFGDGTRGLIDGWIPPEMARRLDARPSPLRLHTAWVPVSGSEHFCAAFARAAEVSMADIDAQWAEWLAPYMKRARAGLQQACIRVDALEALDTLLEQPGRFKGLVDRMGTGGPPA